MEGNARPARWPWLLLVVSITAMVVAQPPGGMPSPDPVPSPWGVLGVCVVVGAVLGLRHGTGGSDHDDAG